MMLLTEFVLCIIFFIFLNIYVLLGLVNGLLFITITTFNYLLHKNYRIIYVNNPLRVTPNIIYLNNNIKIKKSAILAV